MLLSALLGSLGTVAVMAQSNVYSLNVVGYVNVTCYPGFNIVSCPLQASPDNTLNTLLPPAGGQFKKWQCWSYNPTLSNPYVEDSATVSVWGGGGLTTINPGQAVWLYNPGGSTSNVTFVGTVPNGPITNSLVANSFNLVSSAIPASGDVITNSLMKFQNGVKKDQVWTYDPTLSNPYTEYQATGTSLQNSWPAGDPQLPVVGGGFWYLNSQTTNNVWIQSYSVTNQ